MHSSAITQAMRHTLRDQSRTQMHRSDHKITTHRIAYDSHARSWTGHRAIIDVEKQAERELARILPLARSHETHCERCFMIHNPARDCD